MSLTAAAKKTVRKLEASVSHALETVKRLGADHADISVGIGKELEVGVRQGDVELVKEAQSSGMSIRVIVDDKVATSATTDLEPAAVEAFLARALEMARISEPDPTALPPPRKELAKSFPELELFDPKTDRIKADRAIKLATAAERAALRADKRITSSEGASFSRSSGHSVFGTTSGFVGSKSGTYQSLFVQAIADDEGGKKRNGSFWTGGRFVEGLDKPAEVGAEAARRAIAQLGSRKLETGTYPVVFDKDAARAIVGLLASCILGDSLYRHRSYLEGKLGERVASEHVTIIDHPLLDRAPGTRPFDGEGRKVRKMTVVNKGILETFLLDTYSARKLGLKPTGSAAGSGGIPHSSTSNFFLKKGRAKPDKLLAGIDKGLYVTRMMGFGFDPVTGNFSRGAEGFVIENGELGAPVGEITVSRNLADLLGGIDMVANDLEFKTSISAPSFRVDHMTVAGS